MCLCTGTPKTINFPFVTNGKLIVFGVLIFKLIRVTFSTIYETWSHLFNCSFFFVCFVLKFMITKLG